MGCKTVGGKKRADKHSGLDYSFSLDFQKDLCLTLGHSERCGRAAALLGLCAGQVDRAEALLVLGHIVLQGKQQALGVLGSQHNAALHVGLGHTGQHTDEVEHDFGTAVGDDGEVGVSSLGHLGLEFNLQLIVVFGSFHNVSIL